MATHTIDAISICSGIGGLDLGVRRALPGVRTILYCEREVSASAILAARMRDGLLESAPVWSDVATLTGAECSDYIREATGGRGVGMLYGGIPCFAAGTFVLTIEGYRPIETLSVGDRVLTHKGRWRKITNFMVRDDVALRRVDAQGVPGIVTTDEHPFYARSSSKVWDNNKRRYVRSFGNPEWCEASKLCTGEGGNYIAQVLPPECEIDKSKTIERNPAFWWLVGRYLADGWRVDRTKRKPRGNGFRYRPMSKEKRGKTIICCAKKEAEYLKDKIEEAGFHPMRCNDRTAVKFHIASTWLWKFLEPFGKYAHGKCLPGFVFSLPKPLVIELIEGYLSGDGHRERYDHRRATTVSKALALSFALLAQRAYGTVSGVRFCKMRSRTTIEGREVNQRDSYIVSIYDSNRSAFIDGDYGWKLVRKNEPCGRGRVFNISVEEDESYVADGAVVHNCQPHSVAGKRRGADDERDLWPVTLRAIEHYRPGLFFLENVPGILGFMSARIVPDLRRVGYVVPRPCLLAASDVGASQRRERVFLLAIDDCSGRMREELHLSKRGQGQPFFDGDRPSGSVQLAVDSCERGGQESAQPRRCDGQLDGGDGEVGRTNGARSEAEIFELLSKKKRLSCESIGQFPPGPGFGLDRVAQKVLDALESGEDGASDRFLAELAQWAAWQRILEDRPDLAPAVESEVRRMAHGSAGKLDVSRADQLRGLGNGCVPDCVAEALRVLLGRIEHALHRVR